MTGSIKYYSKNFFPPSFEAICSQIIYMTGSIKYYPKKFSFWYYLDRTFVQQDRRFCKVFTLITEMYADRFAGGKFKPLLETQSCTLFTHSCISLCACGRTCARIQMAKSSTNSDASEPFKTDLTILLIFRLKRTRDKMLPWGTPISCSYVSDRVDPALTWNSRWDRNISMKVGKWPRKSRS